MSFGHFIWTDLSTYDLATARHDYKKLFGWGTLGDQTYDFAFLDGVEVAGLFTMPPKLAALNLPSFWMSYVRVPDVSAAVEKAARHDGVIIEVQPQPFGKEAHVALVRDPSGAGFTLYEGPELAVPTAGPGRVVGRYHHLADVAQIASFYGDLFGWRFHVSGQSPWRVHEIMHPDGSLIARVEEVPEDIRGTFAYWMPCFGVASLPESLKVLKGLSGAETCTLTEGRVMVADRQGAHFMLAETDV